MNAIASPAELAVHISGKDISAARTIKDVHKEASGLGKVLGDVSKVAGGFLAANVIAGGMGKLTGAIGDSISAARESIMVNAQLGAVIKSTGGIAGVNAKNVTVMASAMEKLSLFEDEAIIKSSSLLLTFTKVGRDTFPRAQQAILDLSQAMGTDLQSSTIMVGKALNDPIKGITAMSRAGIQFTADQKKMIKEMTLAGNVTGAQAVILKELETQFGGSAKAASDAAGASERYKDRMNDLKEEIGAKLLPIQEKWKELQLATISVIAKLLPVVSKIAEKVLPALSAAIAQVVTFAQTHWPLISQVFQDGFVVVRDAVKNVVENVRELIDLFKLGFDGGQIGGEFSLIERAAFTLGQLFRNTIIPAFNDAKDAVRLFMLGIQGGDAGGELGKLGKAALDVGRALKPLADFFTESRKEILIGVAAAIGTGLVLAFTGLAVAAGSAALGVIAATWPLLAIGAAITGAVAVTLLLIKHWDEIKAKAFEVWNSIPEPIRAALDFMRDHVKTQIDGVIQTFSGLVEIVKGIVKLVDAIIHGEWADAWDALKEVVKGAVHVLEGSIKSYFGNIPAILLNVGKEIMDGLWKGMKEKFEDIKRWVGGVGDTISNLKGPIARDRVLLQPQGQAIMEGLQGGMADTFDGKIKPWLASVAGQVSGAVKSINTNFSQIKPPSSSSGSSSFAGSGGGSSGGSTSTPIPGVMAAGNIHPRLAQNPNIRRRYAQGTDYVPETGLAMLHRGEAVIPAGRNRGVTIIVNVMGSIRSDNELAEVIRDKILGGGFRGVIATT